MTQKSKKKSEKKITIPKREPGKVIKPNFMQNLRQFPSANHPVEDLLGLDIHHLNYLDAQTSSSLDDQLISNTDALARPSLGDQNNTYPDDQPNSNLDDHKNKERTTKTSSTGQPNDLKLDDQTSTNWTTDENQPGRPIKGNLDDRATNDELRSPKKAKSSVVQPTNKNKSDDQKTENPIDWKKYEKSRSTDRVGLRPNPEILKKFKYYCVEKNLNLTEFFELSGLKYIELDDQTKNDLDARSPLDDRRLMMLYKSKPFIINLYLRYNMIFNELSGAFGPNGKWAAKWSPRDDEMGNRYNELDPRIVELGIIQTQINKGIGQGKIQTFKYYNEEIEKVLSSGVGDEMLGVILDYHRKIWKETTKREIDLTFLEVKE